MSDASKRSLPDDSDSGLVDHEFEDESNAAVGDMQSPEEIAALMEAHQVPTPFLNETVAFETLNVTSWYPELALTNVDKRLQSQAPKRVRPLGAYGGDVSNTCLGSWGILEAGTIRSQNPSSCASSSSHRL